MRGGDAFRARDRAPAKQAWVARDAQKSAALRKADVCPEMPRSAVLGVAKPKTKETAPTPGRENRRIRLPCHKSALILPKKLPSSEEITLIENPNIMGSGTASNHLRCSGRCRVPLRMRHR